MTVKFKTATDVSVGETVYARKKGVVEVSEEHAEVLIAHHGLKPLDAPEADDK